MGAAGQIFCKIPEAGGSINVDSSDGQTQTWEAPKQVDISVMSYKTGVLGHLRASLGARETSRSRPTSGGVAVVWVLGTTLDQNVLEVQALNEANFEDAAVVNDAGG